MIEFLVGLGIGIAVALYVCLRYLDRMMGLPRKSLRSMFYDLLAKVRRKQ